MRVIYDDTVTTSEMFWLMGEMCLGKKDQFAPQDIFHYSLRDEKKERAALLHGTNVTARDHDNTMLGYLRVVSDRSYIHYLVDVMVHPSNQNQGIGTRMIEQTLKELKELGFIKVLLTAIPGKEDFYKQFGFKETLSPVLALRGEDYK